MASHTQIQFPAPDVRRPSTLLLAAGGAAYRFLTVTLDRDMRDNATLLYDATKITGTHPSRKLSRAKWRRASARWSLFGLPAAMETAGAAAAPVQWVLGSSAPAWATLPWHDLAAGTVGASAVAWAGVGMWHAGVAVRDRAARKVERRVGEAIQKILGPDADVYKAVRLSPDWGTGDRWVQVFLPNDWQLSEGRKTALINQVGARLGFNAPTGQWATAGPRMQVTVLDTPAPPERLLWADVAAQVRQLDVHRVLYGIGPRGPLVLSLDTDSPHTAVSGATGVGKSTLMKLTLAQRLRNGVGVILLDHKNSAAYDFIRDLPSDMARAYTRPDQINTVLVLLHQELQWRIAAREVDRGTVFRRLDVVVEETNSLPGAMAAWWRGEKRAGEAPWLNAREQLIYMGREYGIHVHYVGQQIDASVFAKEQGTTQRINFGIRALAGYEKTTWAMLAYGHEWRAEPDGPIGIWTVVTPKRVDLVRVPYITDDEATRWALSGSSGEERPLTHGVALPDTGESLIMSEITADLLRQGATRRPAPAREEGARPRPGDLFTIAEWAAETGQRRGTVDQRVRRASLSPAMKRAGSAGDLFSREDLERVAPSSSSSRV